MALVFVILTVFGYLQIFFLGHVIRVLNNKHHAIWYFLMMLNFLVHSLIHSLYEQLRHH